MATSRHLAAVMITDMVGYGTLVQQNEASALRLLEEHREIVRGVLREFEGREVKTMGDGFLVEFGSAVAATECGVEIQRRLNERNRRRSRERIDLRIGIHVGEVIPEGADILGDAVNIASRLEPLAEPGGILISGPVCDQIRGRTALTLQPLPTPHLKHIFVPIAVFRVDLPWKAPPLPAVTPWTGRQNESGVLHQANDRARQGHGSAVIVLGEPGTGKTRMVEEFLRGVGSSGAQLLRAQGMRTERSVPYALWSEAVRSFARQASPTVLERACGPHRSEVVRLVPEIAERIGAPANPAPSEPELAEDRLMDGILQFLVHLADEAPLVIFLDDVQWADPYSLRLLRRAVKAIGGHRGLLVVGARDRDPSESPGAAELWADCRREPNCAVVALGRLGPTEFDRFLDALVPAPGLAPELRRRMHERCDGNPWFAEELLRRQVEGGALQRSEDGWTLDPSVELKIPETVQQLLRDRLGGVAPATLQVLRAAAVAGTRIPYDLLRHVSGVPDDLLLISVERAIREGLLVERVTPSGDVELAFRDTLTRDVLYEGLSLVRARSYHRLVAEGLERRPEHERREQASQLADHFLRGGVPEKALEYSLIAAGRAVELHAHPEAEHLYRTALDLMEELPTPEARKAEVLRYLAKELELLGRTSAALEKYAVSAELWERARELQKASSVHSWMAMLLNDLPGRESEVFTHTEKAVQLLQAEGESAELAQATYSLAAETLRWRGDPTQARDLFRRSVDLAARFGDTRTETWGTYFLAVALPFTGKDEAIGLANQLIAKLERADDPTLPGILANVGSNLFLGGKGDVRSGYQCFEKAREVARRKGVRRYDTVIALGLAELDRLAGAWASAESVGRRVVAQEPEENLLDRVEATFLLARLATGRGRLEEGARLIADLEGPSFRSLLASPEATLPWGVIRAEYEVERGRLDTAGAVLKPALEEGVRHEPTFASALIWGNALSLAVALAVGRSDPVAGEEWLERLRHLAQALDETWVRAWSLSAEGQVAASRGDRAGAVTALERSLAEWEKVDWPFETAKTLFLLGRAQQAAERPDRAGPTLDRATSLFSQLGADRYVQRVFAETRGR